MDLNMVKIAAKAFTPAQKIELIGSLMENMAGAELREVNRQCVNLIRTERAEVAATFKIGDTVEFTSRGGMTIKGKVAKVNSKTIGVTEMRADGTLKTQLEHPGWRVSPTLLRKSAEPTAVPSVPAPVTPWTSPTPALPTPIVAPEVPATVPSEDGYDFDAAPSPTASGAGSW